MKGLVSADVDVCKQHTRLVGAHGPHIGKRRVQVHPIILDWTKRSTGLRQRYQLCGMLVGGTTTHRKNTSKGRGSCHGVRS